MDRWITEKSSGNYVIAANTHVVMECRQNLDLRGAVLNASMVIPDGMPLIVAARWRGFPLKTRADGPGLMAKALSEEPYRHWRHYLYGSTQQVLDALCTRYPQSCIVGTYAPPFRQLSPEEDMQAVEKIKEAHADVLWVGLGCPKQECWMSEHHERLNVPVMLGVGQAFDVLAGIKMRAPRWMQNTGLEWLYRLVKEPRRLWKRYLVNNNLFSLLSDPRTTRDNFAK
jgi:N-acetylglucosaminyldiphosphoundecaprenol N-acetyl-beta-D-mannosaminyltransferase